MGLIGAAFGIGFVVGPAVGGILSRYSYSLPGYAAAALSFMALLLALVRLPESLQKEERPHLQAAEALPGANLRALGEALRNGDVARSFVVYFLAIFAFSNMQMTFPLFTQKVYGYDAVHNGYLFAFIGLMSAVIQGGLLGRLTRRFGEGPLAITGVFLTMLGLGLVPLASHVQPRSNARTSVGWLDLRRTGYQLAVLDCRDCPVRVGCTGAAVATDRRP
jgi:DHA1 family tetracycline resistance protein-like MFS transporter